MFRLQRIDKATRASDRAVPAAPASLIIADPEVCALLDELLKLPRSIDAVRAQGLQLFGHNRSPSRAAVGRYMYGRQFNRYLRHGRDVLVV